MSTVRQNSDLLIAVFFGLLLVLVAWAYWNLSKKSIAANSAAENLRQCEQIAERIAQIKNRPARVSLEAQSATELASRIETAAIGAQIQQTQIVRIDPQPSRRIAETAYREQPTHLEIRSLTMRQLVTFLHTLASTNPKLESRQIRLTAPRTQLGASIEESWQADITLTTLIYSPKQ